MVDYKKIIGEIFGPSFDEKNPIKNVEGLGKAVEAALDTLTPEQKAAVKAVCIDGAELDTVDRHAYAMGLRSLKHPSRSRTLRPYLNFIED